MEILHDKTAGKFFIKTGEDEAVLKYTLEGDIMNILSVFVPPAFRGQGVAEKLGIEAFEFARAGNLKVIPTCPYIENQFLARKQEYRSLIVPL